MSQTCYIAPTTMGRWAIANAEDPELAWSGSQWVPQRRGLPAGPVQVSNFETKLSAFKEADRVGFEILLLGFKVKQESITCFRCGMTSWSPDDVREKYCGNCHAYHEAI